jgi:hypothetical protein
MFFKKNKKKVDWREADLKRLNRFCECGKTFSYLGRELFVVSHKQWIKEIYEPSWYLPRLCCQYKDHTGRINDIIFEPNEFEALEKKKFIANEKIKSHIIGEIKHFYIDVDRLGYIKHIKEEIEDDIAYLKGSIDKENWFLIDLYKIKEKCNG